MKRHVDEALAKLANTYMVPRERDRIGHDVSNLLFMVPSLVVGIQTLTTNDGSQQRIINLTGTLPIHFNNASYNVPVQVWIRKGYPKLSPLIYVTPTSGSK